MDRALIISFTEKSTEYLARILQKASVSEIASVSHAVEARRLLTGNEFDICIVNAPLPDEFGAALARDIAVGHGSHVILLVNSELFEEVTGRVEEYGVITVEKPVSRNLLWNAIKIASAANKRIRALKEENLKLAQKIEDIRIVDRAKCILMSRLSMTEAEAHRYIEKQSMDTRQPKRKVAEEILKVYEY